MFSVLTERPWLKEQGGDKEDRHLMLTSGLHRFTPGQAYQHTCVHTHVWGGLEGGRNLEEEDSESEGQG